MCLWGQQSKLMNGNMANMRWRCVDQASLAIAFSKRDPPVEMGFQRVMESARRSRSSYIIHFGATSRIEDDGLGSVRSLAMWLSVGLQAALAAARRQLSARSRASVALQACKGHRISAAVFIAPARIMTLVLSSSPGVGGRARATSRHVVWERWMHRRWEEGKRGRLRGTVVAWWHGWPLAMMLTRVPRCVCRSWWDGLHLFSRPPAY